MLSTPGSPLTILAVSSSAWWVTASMVMKSPESTSSCGFSSLLK
jgi:hypothetical protein